MRTFVTDLAAKSSPQGHLSAFKHWLFLRQEVLRYALAPLAVALAFLARLALTPILGDASPYLLFVPAVIAMYLLKLRRDETIVPSTLIGPSSVSARIDTDET